MKALIFSAAVLVACGAVFGAEQARNEERLLDELRDRIDDYIDLRDDAVEAVGRLESSVEAAQIIAQRRRLQSEIRRRRADATQGDIFTPEIRAFIRERFQPILKGEDGQDVRARLSDDAPDPDAVQLDVNAAYPAGLPFPTTPWPLLAALPTLPQGLAYRVIGRDLILLDQPADLIVDYMRNAIPMRVSGQ